MICNLLYIKLNNLIEMSDFIESLVNAGGEVFIVGGFIRDFLCNRKSKDIDLMIRHLSENQICDILKPFGKTSQIDANFGIVIFKDQLTNTEYEIALPRTEISTGPGYWDFQIIADKSLSIETDASRRDATINAIYCRVYTQNDLITLKKENIVDPVNGVIDIEQKIWKCVGDPNKRFVEDPTRMLRCLRQSADLNFAIDETTLKAIYSNAKLIASLPEQNGRFFNELVRMLKYNCSIQLEYAYKSNILQDLKIIDKNTTFDQWKSVIKHLDRANIQNSELDIRIALFLQFVKNVSVWNQRAQITASIYCGSNGLLFTQAIDLFYKKFILIDTKLDMLKLIQQIDRKFKSHGYIFALKMTQYFDIINDNNKFESIVLQCKNYISSTDDLAVNGFMLQEIGYKGKAIGDIKQTLIELIYDDVLINDKNVLIEYCKSQQ